MGFKKTFARGGRWVRVHCHNLPRFEREPSRGPDQTPSTDTIPSHISQVTFEQPAQSGQSDAANPNFNGHPDSSVAEHEILRTIRNHLSDQGAA